jgi:hypothetical protein
LQPQAKKKFRLCHKENLKWKILKKNIFEIWINFFVFNFEKNGHRKWKKLKKNRFSNLDWNMSRKFEMKKFENFIFKIWKFSFLKFEMKISVYFLKKIGHITKWKWKNNWNEEIIYLVYATEIKLLIIPLYHSYHLCIPPYTTCASCAGIQLISAVESFHTGSFPTVI